MLTKNIFGGQSARALFAHYVYEELRKRKFVTVVDVSCVSSQIETLLFGEHDGQWYGELQLTIEPNRELYGKIFAFGQYLEVVKPQSSRDKMTEIVKQQMMQYINEKQNNDNG